MRKTNHPLEDEHMALYEWSGAGAGTVFDLPPQTKPPGSRPVACSVLVLMSSLLILSGCNTQSPAEQAAGDMNMKAGSLYEEATPKPASAESPDATGHAMGEAPSAR